jgi:hypothetical protein
MWYVPVPGLFHLEIMSSRFIFVTNDRISFYFKAEYSIHIHLHVYHISIMFLCLWTLRLLAHLGYSE